MQTRLLLLAVAAALQTIALPAAATILTFDESDPGCGCVSDDYGDRIGDTPNIVLEYQNDFGVPFTIWNGYGDLTNALGHDFYSVTGEVILRPDPGYRVVLQSFDVAGYAGDWDDQRVRVMDEEGTVLFDTGAITVPGFNAHLHLTPQITSSSALRIQLLFFGNLGLDNLTFSQVPEPGVAVLLSFGLVGLAGRRVRAV
jgi:hypothetical protein